MSIIIVNFTYIKRIFNSSRSGLSSGNNAYPLFVISGGIRCASFSPFHARLNIEFRFLLSSSKHSRLTTFFSNISSCFLSFYTFATASVSIAWHRYFLVCSCLLSERGQSNILADFRPRFSSTSTTIHLRLVHLLNFDFDKRCCSKQSLELKVCRPDYHQLAANLAWLPLQRRVSNLHTLTFVSSVISISINRPIHLHQSTDMSLIKLAIPAIALVSGAYGE